MAAGLKKGEGEGGSGETQRSVTWPQCPAGGLFHGPSPATCWMTIWGSGKPHNRGSIIFLVAGTTTTKVKKSISLIWREVGGGTAAAPGCLSSSVVRICYLMQCSAVF